MGNGKNATKGAASTPLAKSINVAEEIESGTERAKALSPKEIKAEAESLRKREVYRRRTEIIQAMNLDTAAPQKISGIIHWDSIDPVNAPITLFQPGVVPSENVLESMEMQTRVKKIDEDYRNTLVDYLESNPDKDLPPVKVVIDASDNNHVYLPDGHHTLSAYTVVGRDTIPARIVYGNALDARISALGQNASHGLRLTTKDKQQKVRIALSDPELVGLSDNMIAEMLQISQPTFSKYRSILAPETKGGLKVGKDGQTYGSSHTTKGGAVPTRPVKTKAEDEAEKNAQAEAIRNDTFTLPSEDVNGRSIPSEGLQNIFYYATEMRNYLTSIQSARKQLTRYVTQTIAAHSDPIIVSRLISDYKEIDKEFKKLLTRLENEVIPYAVDPYTKGLRETVTDKNELCRITGIENGEEMRNPGYATKKQWVEAPEDLRTGSADAWETNYWADYDAQVIAAEAARAALKRKRTGQNTTLKVETATTEPDLGELRENLVAGTEDPSNGIPSDAVDHANEQLEAASNEAIDAALSGDGEPGSFNID